MRRMPAAAVALGLVAALLQLQLASGALFATSWDPSTYPNPLVDLNACGRSGRLSWICDPDHLMSESSANVVEGVLKAISTGASPYAARPCGGKGYQGFQVAVALMKRFKLDASGDATITARHFAKDLHSAWGVGLKECENGALLLLSIQDRQLYLSTGKGTAEYLSDEMVQQVLNNMKPALRDGRIDDAVESAVLDIGLALTGKDIKPQERKDGMFLFGFFGLVIASVFGYSWFFTQKQNRRFKDCKTKLEQLKRDQSALRDRRYVVTSCPICMEDFAVDPADMPGPGTSSINVEPSAPPLPTDDPSARLLGPNHAASPSKTKGLTPGGDSAQSAATKIPLSLPCGHGFCEPCITEWLATKSTCPICRKDINDDDAASASSSNPDPTTGPATTHVRFGFGLGGRRHRHARLPHVYYRHNYPSMTLSEEMALADYEFRLARMGAMYPDFVTPAMMSQWRDDTINGRTIDTSVLDRAMLQNQAVRNNFERSGSRGTSVSFGGGSGHGGGGGGSSW